MNKDADRVNSYNVWNYAEGDDLYHTSMLVDLTLPPDRVSNTNNIIPNYWNFRSDFHVKSIPII